MQNTYRRLKEDVYEANRALGASGLVILTWGNVSGIDDNREVMAIKPSGISYEDMKPEDMVLVSIEDDRIMEGTLRPSSDTPTHTLLYRRFPSMIGITHTHSPYAVGWAQAGAAIPAAGTTHADTFYGSVPVTRPLTADEVNQAYELNTGEVIYELFSQQNLDPAAVPAVLVAQHGPFTWGKSPQQSVTHAVILEEVAKMAFITGNVSSSADRITPVPDYLLDKHYLRKHGPNAYYGQK